MGTLSLEAQAKLEKDVAKKEAKAEKKADAALKKKMVCRSTSIASLVFPLNGVLSRNLRFVTPVVAHRSLDGLAVPW